MRPALRRGQGASGRTSGARDLPEHVLQDAAVAVVVGLARGVDADDGVELDDRAVAPWSPSPCTVRGVRALAERRDTRDVERLGAVQAERVGALAVGELQRQHTHPDEVGAVNALERLR